MIPGSHAVLGREDHRTINVAIAMPLQDVDEKRPTRGCEMEIGTRMQS